MLKRTQDLELVRQPNLVVSIRQPDKMILQPWPTLPGVRAWMQGTQQAWKVLTAGGFHAEAYLEKAVEAVKAKKDAEFEAKLEDLRCNVDAYLTAEEKLAMVILLRFPDWLQRELSVLHEKRRCEGLPALISRQLLAWGLRLEEVLS